MPYMPTQELVEQSNLVMVIALATDLLGFKVFNTHWYSVDRWYLRHMGKYVHWVPSENVSGTNVYVYTCIVCPADCKFGGQEPINESENPRT